MGYYPAGLGLLHLKVDLRKFPAIHTNYMLHNSTPLQYNRAILHGSYARNEILNTTNSKFTMSPSCHFGMRHRSMAAAWQGDRRTSTEGNVKLPFSA